MTVREMTSRYDCIERAIRLGKSDSSSRTRRKGWIKIDSLKDHLAIRGEKRRAGLARILATKPVLIVADEPTSGLDAAIKLQIIDLLSCVVMI